MKVSILFIVTGIFSLNFALAVEREAGGIADRQGIFDFHSDFWINLHHCLYQEALTKGAPAVIKTDAHKEMDWTSSVQFYRKQMVHRDLLFDDGMVALKNSLENQGRSRALSPGPGLTTAIITMLEKAAPIYRVSRWEQDDRSNLRWIGRVIPLVDEHGAEISRELSRVYRSPWPNQPIRVDVSGYANWAGAYTTDDPTRITISSQDPATRARQLWKYCFMRLPTESASDWSKPLLKNAGNKM